MFIMTAAGLETTECDGNFQRDGCLKCTEDRVIILSYRSHTAQTGKRFIFLMMRKWMRLEGKEMKKGGREGSPYGYAVRGVTGSRGRPHAAALSVGILDTADVTYLTAIVLEHEDSGAVNPHKAFPLVIVSIGTVH